MKTNIGTKERIIRFVVAVVLIAVGYFVLSSGWATAAYLLGAVLVLTAAFGFCPAYMACPTSFGVGKKAEARPASKSKKKKK